MDISKLTEWLKLSPRYLLPVSIVTGIALFVPANILNIFGLNVFISQYRAYIGIVFLLSIALLLTDWLIKIYEWVQTKRQQSSALKSGHKRLNNLTDPEKKILGSYLSNKTRSQYLSIDSGVVNGLQAEGLIYRASTFGRLNRWAYNIKPWVWEYLNKHPDLVLVEGKANDEINDSYRRRHRY